MNFLMTTSNMNVMNKINNTTNTPMNTINIINMTSGTQSLSCYICSCDASMNIIVCTYGVQGSYMSNGQPIQITNTMLYSTNGTNFTQKLLPSPVAPPTDPITTFTYVSSNGTYFLYGMDTILYKSTTGPNGSLSSIMTSSGIGNFVCGFISNNGQNIFALNFGGLYKSTNGGSSYAYYDGGYRFVYQNNYKKTLFQHFQDLIQVFINKIAISSAG